jgi:hypothetical protein
MSEGTSGSMGKSRPRLPPAALERIRQGEKVAIETLQKVVQSYTPANPDFIYQPSEINAGCWKVTDHLMAFAEAIFDIQASEYTALYPQLVSAGELLKQEIGPEVVDRTKRFWTKWETLVDLALRARWTPEYYNAYVRDANKPGSEDEKLTHHFVSQLEEVVAARIKYWAKLSAFPDPVRERASAPSQSLPVKEAMSAADLDGGAGAESSSQTDGDTGPTSSAADKLPMLNVNLIRNWMNDEGFTNETLAKKLKVSPRAISSIRNNRNYHGTDAVTKLANLMGRDPEDLYLPPEAST